MTDLIGRSFVNCPGFRRFINFALLDFQGLANGRVIALSPSARFQTRPNVTNSERRKRSGSPENQRSIGSRELSRIETATPVRRIGPADSPGFARANAGGSRGGQILGAM